MSLEDRQKLIERIEELRGSKVICYVTTLRPGVPGQIGEDAVRTFFEHLMLFPSRPVEKLDIFLCSNGGSGTVPWRLTALFREYSKAFGVLIPYRAYSSASLLALGADEIVMHPFGEMGPIDPTVSNDFNPVEAGTGRRLGISVEDVKAYVSFIKNTVGISHEDELVKTIEILANKVHPLALGNVDRFLSQSRLIAKKVLSSHATEHSSHEMEEIIDNMASKLYFHGHPINRKEAKEELKLKINSEPPPELETAIWDLYKYYEAELENLNPFKPADALLLDAFPSEALNQAQQQRQGQFQPNVPCERTYRLMHAAIESSQLSSWYTSEARYLLLGFGPNNEPLIHQHALSEGWDHAPAP